MPKRSIPFRLETSSTALDAQSLLFLIDNVGPIGNGDSDGPAILSSKPPKHLSPHRKEIGNVHFTSKIHCRGWMETQPLLYFFDSELLKKAYILKPISPSPWLYYRIW